MEHKWRKSYAKEDSYKIAEKLADNYDIKPYSKEELVEIIISAVRTKEIEKEKKGVSYYLKDIDTWFNNRLMPNTIILSKEQYKKALYRSLRLLVLADIAKTDFGGSRQRDFGQRWTDFTRGFLGELGIEQFFKEKLDSEVSLEMAEVGDVKKFLPTDLIKVKESGQWRDVKTNVSIKTSKLRAMWLDIGNQLEHSDAFIFIKIGLTTDHLLNFMKEEGFIKKLVEMGNELEEVENIDEEIKKLHNKIPDIKPFPTYIAGFVWQDEMRNGQLEVHTTKSKNPRKIVVGGLGMFDSDNADEIVGIGEFADGKYISSLGSLRWKKDDWEDLKNKI